MVQCSTLAAKYVVNVHYVGVCSQCLGPLSTLNRVWRFYLLGAWNSSKICDTLFSAEVINRKYHQLS
jgi:hypothetical protein